MQNHRKETHPFDPAGVSPSVSFADSSLNRGSLDISISNEAVLLFG